MSKYLSCALLVLAGCLQPMPPPKPMDCTQDLREMEVWLDKHVEKEMGRKISVRKRDIPVISAAAAGDVIIYVGATSLYVAASVVAAVGEGATMDTRGASQALAVGGRAAAAALEKAVQKAAEMPLETQAYAYVFDSRAFDRDRFANRWQAVADCHYRGGDWAEAIRVYESMIVFADALQVRPLLNMNSVYGHLADSYLNLGMPAEAETYRTRQSAEQ